MSQAKGTNHTAATTVVVLTVARGTPAFGDFVVANKTYGAAAFLLTSPTTTSSGAFTFTSSNTSVATVNSTTGLVTVVAPGSTEIAATQAQTLTHTASTIRTTFVVDPASPVISAMPAITKAYGSAAFTLTAPASTSSGAISYTSSNTAVATIDSNTRLITLTGAGSTTITASQVATSTYTIASTSTTLTVENAPEITQLSLSNISSCALTSTGAMKCWGSNSYGQIGTLASGEQKTPSDVPDFTNNISAIAVGDTRMCALTTTGEVKCIGNGVAGSNTSGISSGAISISSGYINSCALMSYGGVKCWGDNWTGQLGDGTSVNRSPAVNVKGLTSGVTEITSGIQFTCALLSGGSVKCWGANNYGQLGDGTTSNRYEPTQVTVNGQPISGVASLSGGYEHACAVLTNGQAMCWGRNDYGQLGDGTTTNRSVPTSVKVNGQPISGIASISGGLKHTCAITTGGAAKCWGHNEMGSLGNGEITNSSTPVNVDGLNSGVLSIDAGKGFTTCATVTGSSVKCWGQSWAGNVGDGFSINRLSPVNVVGLMSSSPSATTLGALILPSSSYTTSSADFTLAAPTSSRPGAITFASSNPAVATVDAVTGLVQIKGTGTAVLAAAIGGNGQYRAASAQVTITVGS
jgi:alpha-tubulin suppressor-like RCC1 family protein